MPNRKYFCWAKRQVTEGPQLRRLAAGLLPVVDSEIALAEFPTAIERLRNRDVFGKIVATF